MLVNLDRHGSGIKAVAGAAQEEANWSQLLGLLCNSIFWSSNTRPSLSHSTVVNMQMLNLLALTLGLSRSCLQDRWPGSVQFVAFARCVTSATPPSSTCTGSAPSVALVCAWIATGWGKKAHMKVGVLITTWNKGGRGEIRSVLDLEVSDSLKRAAKKPSQPKLHVVDLWLDVSIIAKYVAFQSSNKKM